jgi:hypothetical protein
MYINRHLRARGAVHLMRWIGGPYGALQFLGKGASTGDPQYGVAKACGASVDRGPGIKKVIPRVKSGGPRETHYPAGI